MPKEILLIDTFHGNFYSQTYYVWDLIVLKGYRCWALNSYNKTIGNYGIIAIRSHAHKQRPIYNTTNLKFIARGGAGMENIDVVMLFQKY